MSASTEAKPNPCSSPNAKAMRARLSVKSGKTLLSAATMIEAAITDSVNRLGRRTTSSAASVSVIECASVKAVTTLRMLTNAGRACGTGSQWPPRRSSTAGSSKRHQEQQVVDAAPDVPDAGLQILDEGPPRRGRVDGEYPARSRCPPSTAGLCAADLRSASAGRGATDRCRPGRCNGCSVARTATGTGAPRRAARRRCRRRGH